jgi:hypothetical protein
MSENLLVLARLPRSTGAGLAVDVEGATEYFAKKFDNASVG